MRSYIVYILMSVVSITISANSYIPPQMSESVAQYIRNSVEPAKPAIESAGRGEVVLACRISPSGDISNVRTRYRVSERLDNAALQLVGGMPRWIPASFEGNNVEVNAEIGVRFFPTRVRLVSSSETSDSREQRRLAKQAVEQREASKVATTTEAEPKAEGQNLFEEFFKSRILSLETQLPDEVKVGEQFRVSIIQKPGDVEMKITFPLFKGFELLMGPTISVQEITKDGEKEVVKTFAYILQAEKAGTFKIEKATGTTKSTGDRPVDITIETKEQTIRVVPVEKVADSSPITTPSKAESPSVAPSENSDASSVSADTENHSTNDDGVPWWIILLTFIGAILMIAIIVGIFYPKD